MERIDPIDEAIDEALGENPREDELAQMVAALEVRRDTFERELNSADSEDSRKQWRAKIKETEKQIEALRNEQAISGFVERSVRASATRPRAPVDWEELE